MDTAGLAMDCRVGLSWYFRCGCPNTYKTKTSFGFLVKNQGLFLLIVRKVEK